MAIERELYMDTESEEENLLVMTVTSCHTIRSPPVALKTAEMMMKWSMRVACGRPDATEMCVLHCHSHVHHLE
jgi:hypothetical protein